MVPNRPGGNRKGSLGGKKFFVVGLRKRRGKNDEDDQMVDSMFFLTSVA